MEEKISKETLEMFSKVLKENLQVEVSLDFGKNSITAGVEIEVKAIIKFNGQVISKSVDSVTL